MVIAVVEGTIPRNTAEIVSSVRLLVNSVEITSTRTQVRKVNKLAADCTRSKNTDANIPLYQNGERFPLKTQ